MKINDETSLINCIDSLKVISAFWIVMGHRKFNKRINAGSFFDTLMFKLIDAYHFAVTTFFVCTAILVTQSFLRALERWKLKITGTFSELNKSLILFRNQLDLKRQYINRFVRFSSSAGVVMLFCMSSLFEYGTSIKYLVRPCKNLKWQALLLIQNFNNHPLVSSLMIKRTSRWLWICFSALITPGTWVQTSNYSFWRLYLHSSW